MTLEGTVNGRPDASLIRPERNSPIATFASHPADA
jgi:hypothetical protein